MIKPANKQNQDKQSQNVRELDGPSSNAGVSIESLINATFPSLHLNDFGCGRAEFPTPYFNMSLNPPSMLCSSQVLYQGRLRVKRMSVNQAALESVTVCLSSTSPTSRFCDDRLIPKKSLQLITTRLFFFM